MLEPGSAARDDYQDMTRRSHAGCDRRTRTASAASRRISYRCWRFTARSPGAAEHLADVAQACAVTTVKRTRVYYNSACPVCNAGIAYQRRKLEGGVAVSLEPQPQPLVS
jgi:hypothetical protein